MVLDTTGLPSPPIRNITPRCPSRHRDAEDFRYVLRCSECGAIRRYMERINADWEYPARTRRGR